MSKFVMDYFPKSNVIILQYKKHIIKLWICNTTQANDEPNSADLKITFSNYITSSDSIVAR